MLEQQWLFSSTSNIMMKSSFLQVRSKSSTYKKLSWNLIKKNKSKTKRELRKFTEKLSLKV